MLEQAVIVFKLLGEIMNILNILVMLAVLLAQQQQVALSTALVKNLGKVSKEAITKIQKLADSPSVTQAVKRGIDEDELVDLKELLEQGDLFLSEAVSLAYYRTLREKQLEFTSAVSRFRNGIQSLALTSNKHKTSNDIIQELDTTTRMIGISTEAIRQYESTVNTVDFQISDLVKLIEGESKFDTVFKLCCRDTVFDLKDFSKGNTDEVFSKMADSSMNLGLRGVWMADIPLQGASKLRMAKAVNGGTKNDQIKIGYAIKRLERAIDGVNLSIRDLEKAKKRYKKSLLDTVK